MNNQYLDFEQPIAELKDKIKALRMVSNDNELNISEEIQKLETKSLELTKKIFSSLEPWQVVQMSRHPQRPLPLDYINEIFTEFDECFGDRHYSKAPAIVGGLARLEGQAVMVIGQQKGKKTKEKVYRNFGMARPEEYRRALRLMKLAERFSIPVVTFIDTAGAYPGIGAEERNQSEAIARNLKEMTTLKVPIISIVVGEAGSGGALAIGMGDKVYMLEYSIYSVISPEGCASILWKSADYAKDAAKSMGVTAKNTFEHGLVDGIINEPLGGAHRNFKEVAASIKKVLLESLSSLKALETEQLLHKRFEKFLAMGACE